MYTTQAQAHAILTAFADALSRLGTIAVKPTEEVYNGIDFTFDNVNYWARITGQRIEAHVETVRHGNDWYTKWDGSAKVPTPNITMAADKTPAAQARDFLSRLHKREGITWWAEAQAWKAAQETAQAQKEAAITELVSATPGVRKNTWNDGISAPSMTIQYSSDGKFTLSNLYRSLTVDQVRRIAAIVAEAA